MTRLTIGMATYRDFDGVFFTLQSLRMYQDLTDCDLLVIDNAGDEHTEHLCESMGVRYVAATEVTGTAPAKNRVFAEAKSEWVLCCDSHVLFAPGAIARLKDYQTANPASRDLLQGPLLHDDLASVSTHYDPVWQDEQWGVWATDPRGIDPDAEPFEIPMQGMGAFSCRTAAWVGFNPAFRGFGGEEGYIHEKFRQNGGRALCLPWLRWVHRFARPAGIPYPIQMRDKLHNYFTGFAELGLDDGPVVEHFARYVTRDSVLAIREESLRMASISKGRPGHSGAWTGRIKARIAKNPDHPPEYGATGR